MSSTMGAKAPALINPSGTEEFYDNWHFSQGVRVGDTLWISGQLGIGPNSKPGTTIAEQTRLAFQNLSRVLEAAGGSLADVVELTTYHIAMDDLPQVAAVKDEFISQNFPAWTAVGVTQLAFPELLIEIKATAVIGSQA